MPEEIKKPVESPTAPESPATEPETRMSDDEINAFVETLSKAGIQSTKHLEGQLSNAREYGKVVNALGEVRQENKALLEELNRFMSQQKAPASDDSYYEPQNPVDIRGTIKDVFKELKSEEIRQQMEAQKRANETRMYIENDEDYQNVKNIWEERLRDPSFMYGIQSGQVDVTKEYHNTVRKFYKGLTQKSAEMLKTFMTNKTNPASPKLETDAHLPGSDFGKSAGEKAEKLKIYKTKLQEGGQLSETETLDALSAILIGGK